MSPLLPFFDAARVRGEPLVLATLIKTAGSTYRKSGAQLLIAESGDYVGLLSGGCLEGDLREHARAVLATGHAQSISYDMRTPDDELWGLGAGCEGAMEILLQRMGAAEDWQPFAGLSDLIRRGERGIVTLAVPRIAPGQQALPYPRCWIWQLRGSEPLSLVHGAQHGAELQPAARRQAEALASSRASLPVNDLALIEESSELTLISLPYAPAPALLLLGAGPDAPPVAQLAHFLGWRVAIYDHRAALIDAARFPAGATLGTGPAQSLAERFDPACFDAAVVMSHQLNADREYLRALAAAPCRYIGLLGPAPRREKLLGDLSASAAQSLRPVLHAPVGLDLGGRSPEAIALSIVAGIQAHLHGRRATAFGPTESH